MPRQNPQALLQNLQDAGCGEGLITQFLTLYQAGQYPQSLALLAQHRRTLLQHCHEAERRIACLDYLVYQMESRHSGSDKEPIRTIHPLGKGGTTMNEPLTLSQEWDKTFPKSDQVDHCKITFHNRYGIPLAGDLYRPKKGSGRLAAIAVCGPFGAVKEQAAGLYAQALAERGFLTLAFDPSFTGESGGLPRYMASPGINTEDFQAAVDCLSTREDVDPEKIGLVGICGWGGLALNTAAIDTRVKATVTSTMYDMGRVNAKGYFDQEDSEEARHAKRQALNAQRTKDYQTGTYALGGGVVDPLPEDAPFFVKDYHDYYKTNRGYHKRSLNSNGGWNVTGCLSFLNQPILQYSHEIRSAVLVIHGEKAHSCYMSRDAFANMMDGNPCPENKELLLLPGAVHTDLYDRMDVIPFDKITAFFRQYL